jgi:hypothetical protein
MERNISELAVEADVPYSEKLLLAKLNDATRSSADLVQKINRVSARYTSLSTDNASKDKAKTIAHLSYILPYLQRTAVNIQDTDLAQLKLRGVKQGVSGGTEEFSYRMADEYGMKCLWLTASLAGLAAILDLENPSWYFVKTSVVKIGQILLGKNGKKYSKDHIKEDSMYRFFEKYRHTAQPN